METDSTAEKHFIHVLDTELSPEIIERFAPDLQELEKDIQCDIEKLKKYAKSKNYPPFDDHSFLCFLRAAKYDFNKAKKKLKQFCRHTRDYFYEQDMDVDMIRTVLEHNMVGILPFRDKEGNAVLYTRGDAWRKEICDFSYFVFTFYLVVCTIAAVPLTSLTGFSYIADVSANCYADYFMFQKTILSQYTMAKGIPARIKHINVVKDNALCRHLYKLSRPILPAKIVKRVYLHGFDKESLHRAVDPDILPTEYGGTLGPLNNEFFIDKILAYYETFKEHKIHYKTLAEK